MDICARIESVRPKGKVTCKIFHGVEIASRKQVLRKLRFYALPDYFWAELEPEEAKETITRYLSECIEDGEQILPSIDVEGLSEAFISKLGSGVKFYTNCEGGYECISRSSYLDLAVIAESEAGMVGIICVEDNEKP